MQDVKAIAQTASCNPSSSHLGCVLHEVHCSDECVNQILKLLSNVGPHPVVLEDHKPGDQIRVCSMLKAGHAQVLKLHKVTKELPHGGTVVLCSPWSNHAAFPAMVYNILTQELFELCHRQLLFNCRPELDIPQACQPIPCCSAPCLCNVHKDWDTRHAWCDCTQLVGERHRLQHTGCSTQVHTGCRLQHTGCNTQVHTACRLQHTGSNTQVHTHTQSCSTQVHIRMYHLQLQSQRWLGG